LRGFKYGILINEADSDAAVVPAREDGMRQQSVLSRSDAGVSLDSYTFSDPVFVVCNGRSGSTLLRFLLDAHPELACPPETNLPALCAQLATVWSLIEGAPLSANRGDEPPEIPESAIAGIRATMDRMIGSYLARRGKTRYCDKSLGAAQFAELLLRVYPEARFLCLYRHPMDVIASGLEACPWGLSGYGFEPYIAMTPANAVLALARFWAENTAATLAVEERFGDLCLRIRYEDLVTDAEGVAAGIFAFLDAAPAPGISAACFSGERERFGPADHKIWYTSKISSESVGRGWSVPSGMIAPPVLAGINELAGKLGYMPVGDDWGNSAPPADLRIPLTAGPANQAPDGRSSAATAQHQGDRARPPADGVPAAHGPVLSRLLGDRLAAGLEQNRPQMASRWNGHGGETFVAVWIPSDPRQPAEHWLIDLGKRTVALTSQSAQEDSVWDIIGSAEAWQQLIAGRLNMSVALRACQIRYCDSDEASSVASEARIAMLANLLGITSW
jgi:sulfotransferase family protein